MPFELISRRHLTDDEIRAIELENKAPPINRRHVLTAAGAAIGSCMLPTALPIPAAHAQIDGLVKAYLNRPVRLEQDRIARQQPLAATVPLKNRTREPQSGDYLAQVRTPEGQYIQERRTVELAALMEYTYRYFSEQIITERLIIIGGYSFWIRTQIQITSAIFFHVA